MKYCPYCGAEILSGAFSFCPSCGESLPVLAQPAAENTLEKPLPRREKAKKEVHAKESDRPGNRSNPSLPKWKLWTTTATMRMSNP